MGGIQDSVGKARAKAEAQRKADYAAANARQKALDKATDKKTGTRRKKLDDNTAKINKGIDKAANAAKSASTGAAKFVNSAFKSAKANKKSTARGGDYNKMSSGQILGDMATRGAKTAYNAGVTAYNAGLEASRQVAKFGYNNAKAVKDGIIDVGAGAAKLANEADTAVKKFKRSTQAAASKVLHAAGATVDKTIADVKAEVKDSMLGALGWAAKQLDLD